MKTIKKIINAFITKIKKFKVKHFLGIVHWSLTIFLCVALFITIEKYTFSENYVSYIHRHNIELNYYSSKQALVDSIDVYIKEIAPTTCMNSIAFVDMAETYNVNPFFIVAQCQNESSFGTSGLAVKTNSAFGVKAYDGNGSKYMEKYEHPDLSIEPYLILLTSDYLVNGITEYDLMKKYVNKTIFYINKEL